MRSCSLGLACCWWILLPACTALQVQGTPDAQGDASSVLQGDAITAEPGPEASLDAASETSPDVPTDRALPGDVLDVVTTDTADARADVAADAPADTSGDASCASNQGLCNGRCIPLDRDPANCGACGNACPMGYSCVCGGCFWDCSSGMSVCCLAGPLSGPTCTSLISDPRHCGTCGTVCPTGEACVNGLCTVDCDTRHALCDRIPPTCAAGTVPSVTGACYGPCVAPNRCQPMRCDSTTTCPDDWICNAASGTCRRP